MPIFWHDELHHEHLHEFLFWNLVQTGIERFISRNFLDCVHWKYTHLIYDALEEQEELRESNQELVIVGLLLKLEQLSLY